MLGEKRVFDGLFFIYVGEKTVKEEKVPKINKICCTIIRYVAVLKYCNYTIRTYIEEFLKSQFDI